MRPACACCSCSGSKLPGKTPCNLWPTMRFSFPPPPDDQNFPDPLSLSSSAVSLAGPRVRRPTFLLSLYYPPPQSVFFWLFLFFPFYYLKTDEWTDGRKNNKKKSINSVCRVPAVRTTSSLFSPVGGRLS